MIGTDRASLRYRAIRPDDGALRERLKVLAQQRRRFGYRRLHVLLRREGELVAVVPGPNSEQLVAYLKRPKA